MIIKGVKVKCSDCHKFITHGDIEIDPNISLSMNQPRIVGKILNETADHHNRLKRRGPQGNEGPQHNYMTVYSGQKTVGHFTTSHGVQSVSFIFNDRNLTNEYDEELVLLRRQKRGIEF